jgi:pimeloyl-ACP methyl ester carboxylesterase
MQSSNHLPGQYCQVNGIKLYYEIHGKGEPLLLLHGNSHSGTAFFKQVPFLERYYKLIVVDCRGRGRSSGAEGEISYGLMAADTHLLLEQLGETAVHVLGWSDGGIIGLLLAMQYPARVKRLLACGINIQTGDHITPPIVTAVMKKTMAHPATDPFTRKCLNMLLTEPNIPYSDLAAVQCPVLIMAGDQEEISAEHTLAIFRHLPKAQLCILPGATHSLVMQRADEFNAIAHRFFSTPFQVPNRLKDWEQLLED